MQGAQPPGSGVCRRPHGALLVRLQRVPLAEELGGHLRVQMVPVPADVVLPREASWGETGEVLPSGTASLPPRSASGPAATAEGRDLPLPHTSRTSCSGARTLVRSFRSISPSCEHVQGGRGFVYRGAFGQSPLGTKLSGVELSKPRPAGTACATAKLRVDHTATESWGDTDTTISYRLGPPWARVNTRRGQV